MKTRKGLFVLLSLLLVVVFTAPSVGSAEKKAGELPKRLILATPSSGTLGYRLSAGMANVWNKRLPTEVTIEATAGGYAWFPLMREGKVDLGSGGIYDATNATRGMRRAKGQKDAKLRTMAVGAEIALCVYVNPKAGIDSFKDLKGKRVIGFFPKLGAGNEYRKIILDYAGLTKKDLRLQTFTSVRDSISTFVEGKSDAFIFAAIPMMEEIRRSIGLKILPLPQDLADKMRQIHPAFHPTVISAKRWRLPKDIPAVGYVLGLFAREDLNPDIVRTLMKTLYDNFDEFKATHPAAKDFALDKMGADPNLVSVPWHKGAITYLKEGGRWTAEHQKLQEELLGKLAK